MKNKVMQIGMAVFLLASAGSAAAATPASMMADYESQAKQKDAGFKGFSADRGRAFYAKEWPTPDGPESCSSCHTKDPRAEGKTRVNKVIKPMAPSANSARFTDPAKTEKWFRRNCGDVLGRECSPQEKGDLISYLLTLK
jgi:hypothetical protein